MKYFALAAVFTLAAILVKAQKNPLPYTYKQKPLNNSFRQKQLDNTLQALFPDLKSGEAVPVQYNMPVLPLKNDGTYVGSNALGEIYSMSVDQMPCLKPYKSKDEIPNALKEKQLQLVEPQEKK